MEFVADVISATAWPLVVFALVFVLREPVKAFLNRLADSSKIELEAGRGQSILRFFTQSSLAAGEAEIDRIEDRTVAEIESPPALDDGVRGRLEHGPHSDARSDEWYSSTVVRLSTATASADAMAATWLIQEGKSEVVDAAEACTTRSERSKMLLESLRSCSVAKDSSFAIDNLERVVSHLHRLQAVIEANDHRRHAADVPLLVEEVLERAAHMQSILDRFLMIGLVESKPR